MAQKFVKGRGATVHRLDLPCEQTGFLCPPPFDVHLKVLPNAAPLKGWTLLAHAAAGKPDALARWLGKHPNITNIRVEPGLAPKLLRATLPELPPLWASAASFVRVHHLDIAADGHASWFIEGEHKDILAFVQDLEQRNVTLEATEVRVRPVHEVRARAPLSRRQFEALASAVALGYYEIPHRLDLRALAAQTGTSLGSLSELLRRAEAAVLTHYVDRTLMAWPGADERLVDPFRPVDDLLGPPVASAFSRRRHSRPPSGRMATTDAAADEQALWDAEWPVTR